MDTSACYFKPKAWLELKLCTAFLLTRLIREHDKIRLKRDENNINILEPLGRAEIALSIDKIMFIHPTQLLYR